MSFSIHRLHLPETNARTHGAPIVGSRRALVAAIAFVSLASVSAITARGVHAQVVRPFPATARLGRFEMGVFPDARLDDEPARLAAGVRIYDAANRIVMPSTLSGTYDVLVDRDLSGQIGRVWILTPEELEAARQRTAVAPQQTAQ